MDRIQRGGHCKVHITPYKHHVNVNLNRHMGSLTADPATEMFSASWSYKKIKNNKRVKLNKVIQRKPDWPGHRKPLLLIGRFTSVDPIAVNVHWFWKVSYRGLELLQAHCARYDPRVASPFHLDIAGLLVVAEGTGELGVQVPRQLLLGRRLSLRLSASHPELLLVS